MFFIFDFSICFSITVLFGFLRPYLRHDSFQEGVILDLGVGRDCFVRSDLW